MIATVARSYRLRFTVRYFCNPVGKCFGMLLRFLIFATLFLLGVPTVGATDFDQQQCNRFLEFSEWQPIEKEILHDLRDGQLDQRNLIEAALVVGGNDGGQIVSLRSSFKQSCERCRAMMKVRPQESMKERIQQLFEYFVSNHLYGEYTPDLCDVGKTISTGEFNCLTATILFRALCEEFDIEVFAAWEPSHVRCWIPSEAESAGYLVETTADNPVAGVSGLYPTSKLNERRLTSEELLGKVFYNRGVRALQSDQFSLALTSTWASCLLDTKDVPAQNNLRACLNNWALSASQHDDSKFAIRLLDAGLQLDPNYEPFFRNRRLLLGH